MWPIINPEIKKSTFLGHIHSLHASRELMFWNYSAITRLVVLTTKLLFNGFMLVLFMHLVNRKVHSVIGRFHTPMCSSRNVLWTLITHTIGFPLTSFLDRVPDNASWKRLYQVPLRVNYRVVTRTGHFSSFIVFKKKILYI